MVSPADFITTSDIERAAAKRQQQERAAEEARKAEERRRAFKIVNVDAALRALKPLKALQSATRAGVIYQAYLTRLADAQIALDEAMPAVTEPAARELFLTAMHYYRLAATMWEFSLRSPSEAESFITSARTLLSQLDCAAARNHSRSDDARFPKFFLNMSVSRLWSCASEQISTLDVATRR